jgi:membrane-associated phospholipid phosphatase
MPVVNTTSPAWDRALPKDQPEYSEPSSRTSFAGRASFFMVITPARREFSSSHHKRLNVKNSRVWTEIQKKKSEFSRFLAFFSGKNIKKSKIYS